MNNEELLKYIGVLVVIGIIIYMIIKLANIQLGVVQGIIGREDDNIIEGMTNKDKNKKLEDLEDLEMMLTKELDMEKERIDSDIKEKIENNLIKFDELLNYYIVNATKNLIKGMKDKDIERFNKLMTIKENLQKIPDILEEV